MLGSFATLKRSLNAEDRKFKALEGYRRDDHRPLTHMLMGNEAVV
jgi:hypothetical protein